MTVNDRRVHVGAALADRAAPRRLTTPTPGTQDPPAPGPTRPMLVAAANRSSLAGGSAAVGHLLLPARQAQWQIAVRARTPVFTVRISPPAGNHPGGRWRSNRCREQFSGMRNEGDKPTFGIRPTFGRWPGERDTDARETFEAALDDPAELRSLIDPDDQPWPPDGDESERHNDRRTQPRDDHPRPHGPHTTVTSGAQAPAPSPLRRPVPAPLVRRGRWPSVAAAGLIGLLIFGGGAAILDTDDAEQPPPASALRAPPAPITAGPVLPAGTERWVADAQAALAAVRDALAVIENAEREWNAMPVGRREGMIPPAVVELQARKASLRQQEATLVADLASVAAVHDSARQVRALEVQLAELQRTVPSPAPPTVDAQRVEDRERMLREQLQTRREELTRWQSGAYTAITTPLPDPPPAEPVATAVINLTRQPEDPTPDNQPASTSGLAPGREPEPEDDQPSDEPDPGEPPDPETAGQVDDTEPGATADVETPSDGTDITDDEQIRPDADIEVPPVGTDANASPVDAAPLPPEPGEPEPAPPDDALTPAHPSEPDVPAEPSIDPDKLYEHLERIDAAVEALDEELDRLKDDLRPQAEHAGGDSSDIGDHRVEPGGSRSISEEDAACECDDTSPDATGGDRSGDDAGDDDATGYDESSDDDMGYDASEKPEVPKETEAPDQSDRPGQSSTDRDVHVAGDLRITGEYDSASGTGHLDITGHLSITDGADTTLEPDSSPVPDAQAPACNPTATPEAPGHDRIATPKTPQPPEYLPGTISATL